MALARAGSIRYSSPPSQVQRTSKHNHFPTIISLPLILLSLPVHSSKSFTLWSCKGSNNQHQLQYNDCDAALAHPPQGHHSSSVDRDDFLQKRDENHRVGLFPHAWERRSNQAEYRSHNRKLKALGTRWRWDWKQYGRPRCLSTVVAR